MQLKNSSNDTNQFLLWKPTCVPNTIRTLFHKYGISIQWRPYENIEPIIWGGAYLTDADVHRFIDCLHENDKLQNVIKQRIRHFSTKSKARRV